MKRLLLSFSIFTLLASSAQAMDLKEMYNKVMNDAQNSAVHEAKKTTAKEGLKTGAHAAGVTNVDREIEEAVDTADTMIKGDPCTKTPEELDPKSREASLIEADRRIAYYKKSQDMGLLDARKKVEEELGIQLDLTSGVVPTGAANQVKTFWNKIMGN